MKAFKKLATMALVISLLAITASITPTEAADKPGPKTTAILKAAGASPGGVGFMLLTGISKYVKETYPRVEITVVPGGFVGNLMRVNKGEVDLAATTISLAAMAEQKDPPYDKEDVSRVRALMSTQNEFNFFAIVRKDLEVESIGDLFKKKLPVKLCTLHKGTATELVWRNVFLSQGISWDDISEEWGGNVSFVTWGDAVNLVKDGHADGILAVGSRKIGWALDLSHARDIKILKWDKELLELVQKKFGLLKGKIPAGTYKGVKDDVTVPFTPCQIVVGERVSDDAVQAILYGMYENAEKYAKHHKALNGFTAKGMATGVRLPLHPAAKEFYTDHNIPIQ